MDKVKGYLNQLSDIKGNNNSITQTINKSVDCDVSMPTELEEHTKAQEEYRELAELAAKE